MPAGEFGIVYKAHYIQDIKQSRNTMPKVVAVKTLKGDPSQTIPSIIVYTQMQVATKEKKI